MSTEILLPPHASLPANTSTGTDRINWVRGLVTGRTGDARWIRPSLLALLVATGFLYIWGLGSSGWANSFYSAAVQAGSQSWKAFFFGSSDASNSITVDKPPASLWIMALSVRIFGLSSWSILVPEALMGVASVGVLYLAVRRSHGAAAGLIAAAAMACSPVAALMFRFNNPDALLVLLMTIAAYCTVRALERASAKWLVYVGILLGFGFLTKMLQALLVVPAFALVYLVCAPTTFWRRIRHLLYGGVALVVAAGWWIAIVSLVPAADRPYIGGSQSNSILQLTLGYNGFGRLTGNETGSVGGGGTTGGMWGATGWDRLFGSEMGSEIAWLLPTSFVLLAAGLYFSRGGRTALGRSSLAMWGGWLLITWATFSFAAGIIHPYYTVALAPAIGAVVGIGAVVLWRNRNDIVASLMMAATLVLTVAWQFHVLNREDSSWMPWLRWTILVVGVLAAIALLLSSRLGRRFGVGVALIALIAGGAAPTAWAVATASQAHTGSIPSTGPAGASSGGFGGGRGGGGGQRGGFGGAPPTGGFGGGPGGPGGPGGQTGTANGGTTNGGTTTGGTRGFGGTGGGGLLNASTPSAAVITALTANSSKYKWVAAAVGSNTAAGYQLATQKAVMPIGGFNGTDPSPTLAQFEALVKAREIHYFIASGSGFGSQQGGSNDSSQITSWVESNYTATTVGGVTLYDLTASQ